jgi:tRNA A-37 threonylcarbamoyl transferase component Bud32
VAGDPNDDTDPAVADTHASAGGSEASSSHSASRGPRGVRSGDTLGRYELAEELGEGGMAQVFKARDKELRRDVALKVLFPHLARRDEIVRRFQREARAAAGLEQANILRIYDVGGAEGDDPPYIVMEMIRGRSLLAEIEQRGPMFAEVAACVGALLADALGAAHKASIVHRDMKPANVMISHDGRVLLTDFGVARLETEDSLVTKTGALLGTPAYMSPEQASGDVATARSDLYSLGATLYQLATGTLPYAGSPAKVLAQIATGSMVPPVKKRASVGPDLSRLIERMMATEPEQRVASAADASAELRAIAASGGLGEPADELATYFADPDAYVKQRTPKIVASVVASAKQALAEAKLPRAMALADRASSLAPADPAVITLLDKVADSGRASRRNRVLAIGALGLALAGGGTVLAIKLAGGGETPAVLDAAVVAQAADAAIDTSPLVPADAPDVVPEVPDATVAKPKDAGVPAKDAGAPTKKDAAVGMAVGLDAQIAAPLDALPAPPDVAIAAKGTIVVKARPWCDVSIDGVPRGRQSAGKRFAIEVEAGSHTVLCDQTGLDHKWTKTVDVPAGGSVTAEGELLGMVDVAIESDVEIDGVAYKAGTTAKVRISRLRVKAGNIEKDISFNGPCRLRLTPEPGCYPAP